MKEAKDTMFSSEAYHFGNIILWSLFIHVIDLTTYTVYKDSCFYD